MREIQISVSTGKSSKSQVRAGQGTVAAGRQRWVLIVLVDARNCPPLLLLHC
jgi:hypothetical protein